MKEGYFYSHAMQMKQIKPYMWVCRKDDKDSIWQIVNVTKFYVTLSGRFKEQNFTTCCKTKDLWIKFVEHYKE